MDTNVEKAITEEVDVGIENPDNERFTEFKKYYRSTAETEAILKELGLPELEVLRRLDTKLPTPKGTGQIPHKKSKGARKRVNKYEKVKLQNENVDTKKTEGNNGIILEENDTKLNKVHDLADSLQHKLAELVIGDRMFKDNNAQGDYEAQNKTRSDNVIHKDLQKKHHVSRYRKGYPVYVYGDLDRCVLVEDWHLNTLKSHLTSLLHVELSKYGVVSNFGVPDRYVSIEHYGLFYVPAFFGTKEAAAKALEAGSVIIESVEHSLTKALPLTESSVVVRIRVNTERRNLAELFKGCGRIRKIKHFYLGKKSTSVIVFGDAESAERALSFDKEFDVRPYEDHNNINRRQKRPSHRNRPI